MPVEIAEEELESLRGAAGRTQEMEAELQALRDSGQEQTRQYKTLETQQNQLIGQVQAYLQQGQQAPPVARPVLADDEPIIERRQWRQEFLRGVETDVNPVLNRLVDTYGQREQMHASRAREQARYLVGLDPDLKPFVSKYGEEIEAMVNGMPLDQQGSVKTYENAVKAVKALHGEEIVEDRVREILLGMAPAEGEDDEDEGEMTDEEIIERRVQQRMRQVLSERAPKDRTAPARLGARSTAVMPTSTRTGGSAAKQRARKVPPLDRTERYYAGLMGLTDEEYHDHSQDLTHDVFGFRDPKTGKMRARV